MKPSLQLRIGQQLSMTPQLQQAIRLLQLSSLELQTEIQEALESNPLLEMEEEHQENALPSEIENQAADSSQETEPLLSASQDATVDLQASDEIPQELPMDSHWEDTFDTDRISSISTVASDEYPSDRRPVAGQTLADHLLWHVQLTPFSEIDQTIAIAIIDSIDESGYLNASLEEIQQGLCQQEYEVELDEVEAMLRAIQSYGPPGVAARDLKECLQLQLKSLDPQPLCLAQAQILVDTHMNLLANRDFKQLMKRMRLTQDELQDIVALIQSLNPRPGYQVADSQPEYVIPDVFVRKHKGVWRVDLNSEGLPRLRVNAQYAGLVRRADNSVDNTYLKNHLQEARWFIKSIQSRNETLLKVATSIVERQQAFFERGEEGMVPLVLHDVAEMVEMHESTISRVTTQKFMHTPRGVFELKYFFSSHVSTASGGACSSTAIRALIKKLIANENGSKPLSDSKIADLIEKEGVNVARRTVAKYREAMAIPSFRERKQLI
ncbi:MAG TPA: RNA polymerase factor sigma-54 [Gammaproteobacteria bacterium]|nr:RNA polymerase factor sigma-54 [Gammaproteobacteria bacterium]